jgi:hypothetical protein
MYGFSSNLALPVDIDNENVDVPGSNQLPKQQEITWAGEGF